MSVYLQLDKLRKLSDVDNWDDLKGKPNIEDDGSETYYITDANGNVIAKIDENGLHTTEVELGGSGEEKVKVKTEIEKIVKHISESPIERESDDALYIADTNGNVIAKIDKDGIHTVQVYIGDKPVSETMVNPDYNENDPTKKSHILNRPFYVDGRGTTENHTITKDKSCAFGSFGLAIPVTPTLDEFIRYKIVATFTDNSSGTSVVTNKTYLLSEITATPLGEYAYRFTIPNPSGSYDNAEVIVVYDYETFNSKHSGNFTANGVYCGYSYSDDQDDNGNLYTNYSEITAIEVLPLIKKIDNKFIDLLNNPEFIALEDKVDEVKSIAKGANQAVSFGNLSTMVTALNALPNDTYNVGQNIYIITKDVPDLWVSRIASTSVQYIFTDDETFTRELESNGTRQVGYYVLSALETQKVDLTNYPTNDDLATLKSELSEEIVSEEKEWHIVDDNGNIIATIDAQGLHTIDVYLDGKSVLDRFEAVEEETTKYNYSINLEYSTSGSKTTMTKVDGQSFDCYLITDKTYTKEQLLGATINHLNGAYTEVSTLTVSNIEYENTNGISFKIGGYAYIFVVFNAENFNPFGVEARFGNTGVYFSRYDDGDTYLVQSLSKDGFADNELIKSLLARIVALENRA